MTSLILICENQATKLTPEMEALLTSLGTLKRYAWPQEQASALSFLQSDEAENVRLALLATSLEDDNGLNAILKNSPLASRCVWMDPTGANINAPRLCAPYSRICLGDLANPTLVKLLFTAFDSQRPVGVKSFLEEGSTVYSQGVFDTKAMGSKLDPLLQLAQESLGPEHVTEAWSAVATIVAEALRATAGQETAKIEIQAGADNAHLCASVRFPYRAPQGASDLMNKLRYRPGLPPSAWLVAKDTANFLEVRSFEEGGSIEIIAVFARAPRPQEALRPVILRSIGAVAMDDASKVSTFDFKTFTAIGQKKGKKVGFKKRFSDQLPPAPAKIVEGAAAAAPESTIVKGEAAAPATTTVMKAAEAAPAAAAGPAPKSNELLESKIASLQTQLQQREELITKLNKEVADSADPTKRGVISSVVDSQKDALKARVSALEEELTEGHKREKELMTMVDQAIKQKDQLMKQIKALELKGQQANSGQNSQVITLKRQLEETQKQREALSKKVSELLKKAS